MVDGDTARVELTTSFSGHVLAVDLVREEGAWLIGRIGRVDQAGAVGPAASETGDQIAPAAMAAQAFYNWYLSFLHEGNDESGPPSILRDGSFKTCGFLTPSYIEALEMMLSSGQPLMADPFLCAQDIAAWVMVEQAIEVGPGVQVNMVSSFEGHGFTVFMREMEPDLWLIDGVQPAG